MKGADLDSSGVADVTVRVAQPRDAPAIAALWNAMIRETLFTFTTVEKTQDGIVALLAERQGALWVAEADGVQGFVTFGAFRAGPGYATTAEHSIVVHARQKRRGVGAQLMAAAERGARDRDLHVLVAGISSANPAAMAFHAARGFDRVGLMPQVARKHGQWLDLVLMQKILA